MITRIWKKKEFRINTVYFIEKTMTNGIKVIIC